MNRKQCLIVLLALFPAACGDKGTEPIVPADSIRALTVDEQQVASASNRFAFDLLREADFAETSKPNLMVSPLSASMALGMILNGAAGSTFSAIRETLAFGDLTQPQINAAYAGLIRQLYARAGTKVQFALANSVWSDDGFTVYSTFTDTLKQYFDAEVRQLDFRSTTAPQTISKWAEDKTNGRIKDLIQQINPEEVMFLVNAVYFKAPWTKEFDPKNTRATAFTRSNGTQVSVPMMWREGMYAVARTSDAIAVELPYADSAYSIVLWMPGPGASPASPVSYLTEPKWSSLLAALHNTDIMLGVPKFHIEYSILLNDILTQLGMGIAFVPLQANFTRISNRDDLYISRVFQKTFIDVNEEGTEAAAATSIGVGVTSAPMPLAFDRPFFFAVRERQSGTILFAGRVGDPSVK